MKRTPQYEQGFTLVEAVIVIVITGIISAVVAVFIKTPVDSYFDAARRAALTDVADTAVRRMARDIRKALPNSIRNPSNQCIEFIPTKTGGRYRAEEIIVGDDTSLNFSAADTTFNMFGSNSALPVNQQIVKNDVIVVYNLGIAGADAYNGDNASAVTSAPSESGTPVETTITIDSKPFPLASGSNRFHVIPANEKIVSFVCSGTTLYRNSNYAYTSSCPTTGGAVLAQNVSCNFDYSGSDLQRNALVRMTLKLTDSSGEAVSLYHEAHVNNTP